MVNVEQLRAHYDALNDDELERLAGTDLVPEARAVLEAEMRARGLAPVPVNSGAAYAKSNPYAAPKSAVTDPHAWATVTVSGLVRLFQVMVVASTLIGIFIFFWPFLPIPTAQDVTGLRAAAGAGAWSAALSYVIAWAMQPLWILSAFGLCFFKWWARPVFAGTYVLGAIDNLVGGLVVWLPWEAVLITIATLLDGAVLALAYLPPLSAYFDRDRASG